MREFKYVATFSDGAVVERRSTRNYLFAWRTAIVSGLSGNTVYNSGFSATRELADKAMREEIRNYTIRPHEHAMQNWKPGEILFAEVVPAVCPEPHSLAEHLNRSMGFGK